MAKEKGKAAPATKTDTPRPVDLRVIVADIDQENLMTALLSRHQSLGIAQIRFEVHRHSGRDSGCRVDAHQLPRLFGAARYYLVVFDHHGCGSTDPVEVIEDQAELALTNAGFSNAGVVVIDPEVEIWLWLDSEHVAKAFGWETLKELREWLQRPELVATNPHVIARGQPVWGSGRVKPSDPKAARLAALEHVGRPQSATLFRDIAARASFSGCTDRAFARLLVKLRTWFPRSTPVI